MLRLAYGTSFRAEGEESGGCVVDEADVIAQHAEDGGLAEHPQRQGESHVLERALCGNAHQHVVDVEGEVDVILALEPVGEGHAVGGEAETLPAHYAGNDGVAGDCALSYSRSWTCIEALHDVLIW